MAWLRAVIVHVTEMGVATLADYVHALRLLACIHVGTDVLRCHWRRETSETAFAFKLGFRAEHGGAAAKAAVETWVVKLEIAAVEGQVAGPFASDVELLEREQLAPLGF